MAHEAHGTTTEPSSCCGGHSTQSAVPAQTSGCCGGSGHSATHQLAAPTHCGSGRGGEDTSVTAKNDEVTTCPVMAGSTVVKAAAEAAGLFRDYQGERYWFCCAACGPMFDAAPDKYSTAAV